MYCTRFLVVDFKSGVEMGILTLNGTQMFVPIVAVMDIEA